MNKKISFLISLAFVLMLPLAVLGAAADPPAMVKKMQEAFVSIGGSVVIIGWIVAGILYLTAAGSPEKLSVAKKALIAAIIGTALIIIAGEAYELIKTYVG